MGFRHVSSYKHLGGSKMTVFSKVGCVFLMFISSEFHIGRYIEDDYREDKPHFISNRPLKCIGCYNDANLCIVITFLHVVFNPFHRKFILDASSIDRFETSLWFPDAHSKI